MNTFSYSIGTCGCFRGRDGDAGAVPVAGATWTASCSSGSPARQQTRAGQLGHRGDQRFQRTELSERALPAA